MDERELAEQVTELQQQVKTLAWLHAALVHEINVLIGQLMGGVAADPARAAALRARAARIARLRANPPQIPIIKG